MIQEEARDEQKLNIQRKEKLVLSMANHILSTGATVREVAKLYYLNKTTVSSYIDLYLPAIDKELSDKIQAIMKKHKKDMHLKGGATTRKKREDRKKKLKQHILDVMANDSEKNWYAISCDELSEKYGFAKLSIRKYIREIAEEADSSFNVDTKIANHIMVMRKFRR